MRLVLSAFLVLWCAAQPGAAQTASATPATAPFQLKLVAPNIWAAIDDAKGDAGANAGFVIGDGGVVVIDTFENEAAARALLAEIRKLTHLPIKFVVNSHYHLDHVAGNRVLADAGAVIVAHRNVRAWVNAENLKFFGGKITPEQKIFVERLLPPDLVYDTGVTLFPGSRRVEIRFFEGHTGGDTVVYVPDAGVVFCGDLFWRKTLPNLIDASVNSWIVTLPQLAALPEQHGANNPTAENGIFVPGHGDVGSAADVMEFQGYLQNLRAMTQRQIDAGKSQEELVAAVLPELTRSYGTWDFFKDFSKSNILDMGAELKGTKRVPSREKK